MPIRTKGRTHPDWLPEKYHGFWDQPYTRQARRNRGFRRVLDRHGYLSPNFTLAEAACHDGTPIPRSLKRHARDHAFRLEQVRHALGDISMPVLSWYRTRSYNAQIGGATQSQHIQADATDFSKAWVDKAGRKRVQNLAETIFADGGVGTYPSGSMHFDSRGYRARWSSW